MSTAIFTFDHGQKKLHKAIGVKEEYLNDLGAKLAEVVRSLKCDEVKQEILDVSPSEIVEVLLNEMSYSQLVLISSFYIREKIEEMEEAAERKFEELRLTSEDIPQDIKDIIDKLEGKALSMGDIPEEIRDKLSQFIKKLRDRDKE
jgi:hypothetical protein